MTGGVFSAIRRGWVLIAALAALGLLGGAGYGLFAPKTYSSSAQVVLTVQANSAADRLQGATYVAQILPTYASAVTSAAVLDPVIASLGLDKTLEDLQKDVDVRTTSESAFVTITAKSRTADGAHQLTDAITQRFVEISPGIISPKADPDPPATTQSANGIPANVVLVVVDEASVPIEPDSPSLRIGLPVGLVAGLVIGVGLTLLLRLLDTRLHSAEQISAVTGVPVLAEMPLVPAAPIRPSWHATGESESPPPAVAWTFEEGGAWGESVRALRSALFTWGQPNEIMLLAGVVPTSGTTTVISALAASLARTGVETILVDASLRAPATHAEFGLEASPGLTDVLLGRLEPRQVQHRIPGHDHLSVVTAGTAGSADLIASVRLPPTVTALACERTMLIDGSAVLASPDIRTLAPLVSAAVLVVPLAAVTEQQLKDAVAELTRSNRPLKGVVVTPNVGGPRPHPARWWRSR